MTFSFHAFRFTFRAIDSVSFPPGKSGNIFRGAFGSIFRKVACVPDCPGARVCPDRGNCPYARMFEPALNDGPSGLADPPRPFVFRAYHLDGRIVRPEQPFHVDVHVFDPKDPALAFFVRTFARLASDGLGPRRGRVELIAVHSLDAARRTSTELFGSGEFRILAAPEPVRLPLDPAGTATEVEVRFETPTELKGMPSDGRDVPFSVLFARVRDRVSTLRTLYGEGPLDIPFRQLGLEATGIRTARVAIRLAEVPRRSSKTGQTHDIGGFVGSACYEGDLSPFVPYLRAAEWTGVGRHTVFGNGVIAVTVC